MNAAQLQDAFSLPALAAKYLDDFYHVLQAWDDFVDGDAMPREEIDRAIYASLYDIPSNPFYMQHAHLLLPLQSNIVLKWKGADTAERDGQDLHKAYMWRAGYFDIVLQVLCIVHGSKAAMENAHRVMAAYGETYEEYAKEF